MQIAIWHTHTHAYDHAFCAMLWATAGRPPVFVPAQSQKIHLVLNQDNGVRLPGAFQVPHIASISVISPLGSAMSAMNHREVPVEMRTPAVRSKSSEGHLDL
jgi:hypothetical protein